MRNRLFTVVVLVGLLACPVLAWGQGKVGLINLQEAIATTQEGRKALTELQKKFQPRQQDLQKQQQDIQALTDQLQKQVVTLSDEERIRLNRELEDKQKLFKRATEDANTEYQTESQDTVRRLGVKMVRILNEYAQANGFAVVLEEGQVQPYFVTREAELTEEITKRYDAAFPVEGAAPAGAAAPAAPTAAKPAAPAAKPAAPVAKPAAPAPKPKP